jgi:hypothetical protein
MNSPPNYEYTDRDLMANPESYEYSEFHGKPFLDAYLADRRAAIAQLDERLEAGARPVEAWDGLLETLEQPVGDALRSSLPADLPQSSTTPPPDASIPDPAGSSAVETTWLLSRILGYPDRRPPRSDRTDVWTNDLIERFEVTKHLSARYDTEMRSIGEDTAPLVAYPMLALSGLIVQKRTGSLKHLNGVLKLCDTLSSMTISSMSPGMAALARLALDEERNAIERLAAWKGVPL